MRNLGVLLIYAAVTLRAVARFAHAPSFSLALGLLAAYGALLLVEPYAVERLPQRLGASRSVLNTAPAQMRWQRNLASFIPWAYLLVQMGLVVALLYLPPHSDFFAGLLAPLSLQAVTLFGWQVGLAWIVALTAVLPAPLSATLKGWPYAAAMTISWAGLNLLCGGYARQCHKAREARRQNQRLLADLQATYRLQQSHTSQVEDLASEQARGRLAGELQESVAQTIFSMRLSIQAARMLAKDPRRASGQLRRLEDLATSAMGEIQMLVGHLRPHSIAEDGLTVALQRLADERKSRCGLEVSVEVVGADEAQPLPAQVEFGLFRIAQEALNNVARHAGATQAAIRLDLSKKPVSLCIEDSGCGFNPQVAAGQRDQLGLPGMAERARGLGWRLTVDSAPGRGTRIFVEESGLAEATRPAGSHPMPAQPGETG